jgi:hypothetical protein
VCIGQGGNQKARDFFIKNKAPIDGKIPEKYNSRAAAAYKVELLRAVEEDMRKNAKKYASSDTAGDMGKAAAAQPAAKDDDEWGWATGTPKTSTPKASPATVAAAKTETPTSTAKPKTSTPGYSSALARSGSPAATGSSKGKLGGSRLGKAMSIGVAVCLLRGVAESLFAWRCRVLVA